MNLDNLDDGQKEAFEAELQETDATAILLGIHAELSHIRALLEDSNTSQSEASEPMYECDICGEVYAESDIVDHATEAHKAPPNMALEDIIKS